MIDIPITGKPELIVTRADGSVMTVKKEDRVAEELIRGQLQLRDQCFLFDLSDVITAKNR